MREPVALPDLVDEAARSLSECPGEASFCFENTVDEAFTVEADREQLFRIVLNLLRNACEALGSKGGSAAGGHVRVSAQRDSDGVAAIEIADSGPGVPGKLRDKLFQPFVSAARPGGSGLGLAIARDLARGHGGDLVLVSTGPDGTVFRLSLPD